MFSNCKNISQQFHKLLLYSVCTECDCMHGVCNKGPEGDGQCLCQPPYTGKRCDQGETMTYTGIRLHQTVELQIIALNLIKSFMNIQ